MKKSNLKDERVIAQQHKIASDAYQLVSIFLLISILFKQLILDEPFSSYMTEFVAFFGSLVYVLIRTIIKGNYLINLKENRIKLYLLNSTITSSAVIITVGTVNYFKYPENQGNLYLFAVGIIIMFVSAFIGSLLTFMGLEWISNKRAEKIIEQYNDPEDK